MVDKNGKSVTNTLADNGYDTNRSRQEITMENLTNEYSAIKETLGYWGDIIKTAIEAIGVLLLTKVVGGVLGKGMGVLAGSAVSGGTGSGLMGALGAAGPIAAGIAGVAAVVGGISYFTQKYYNEKYKNANNNANNYSSGYSGTATSISGNLSGSAEDATNSAGVVSSVSNEFGNGSGQTVSLDNSGWGGVLSSTFNPETF